MSDVVFKIVRARGKQTFRVHILAAYNRKKIFTSETYATRRAAMNATLLVQTWANGATIIDTTLKPRPRA